MQVEQTEQQMRLTGLMQQIQVAISVKTPDKCMKIRLANNESLETSVLGIHCKKEYPSSSFNDVDEIK